MPSYGSTERGYRNLWAKAEIRSAVAASADNVARRIIANRERYEKVAQRIGHPQLWPLIGALHAREADGSFAGVLHNGERIIGTGRRTSLVPSGRGPFTTWESAAVDALTMPGKTWHRITDWPIARWLYEAEAFNGLGYYGKDVNSPYVWGGTNLQQSGKYVADHVWSRTAWDPQLGVAAVLKAIFKLDPALAPSSPAKPAIPEITAAGTGGAVVIASAASGNEAFMAGALVAVLFLIAAWAAQQGGKGMLGLINWKTTLAGIGAILGAVADIAVQISSGNIDPTRLLTSATVILTGLGLIGAKDKDVTGGTISNKTGETVHNTGK